MYSAYEHYGYSMQLPSEIAILSSVLEVSRGMNKTTIAQERSGSHIQSGWIINIEPFQTCEYGRHIYMYTPVN